MTEDKRKVNEDISEENLNSEESQESVEASQESTEKAEVLQKEVSQLIKQLNEAQSIADKNHTNYLHAVADLDNYRRRVTREKEELRKNAVSSFTESLLPVVDNLLLGIQAAKKDEGTAHIVEGFEMVLSQLQSVLEEQGIKVIDPQGQKFDPNAHECVSYIPSEDFEENYVIEVIRIGYSFNNRLIRPATVVVSQGSSN